MIFQTIPQLQTLLTHSLENQNDSLAREILDALELALNEEYIIDANTLTISMVVYLLQDDFYGAKYLWKRAPTPIKMETSEFTKVWNVGKHLIQNSIPNAYQLIKSTEWSQSIFNLIQRLYSHLQQYSLNLIQITYTTIKLSEMMNLLDMSEAQCQEVCLANNWTASVGENETFVSIPQMNHSKDLTQVSQIELLQTFTQYRALCEMANAPLKFDLRDAITKANKGELDNSQTH